jgi:hypothetical protein
MNLKKSYESLENVFKSLQGFEDEMQQEWKHLVTKYELLGSEINNNSDMVMMCAINKKKHNSDTFMIYVGHYRERIL